MPTITFSEAPLGTESPVYTTDDNTISFNGLIRTDGANPTSPVLAGSSDFQAPIVVHFENAVESVSFDAGYFDNLQSTVISVWDREGHQLDIATNNSFGILNFSFDELDGITSVVIRATSTEEAGFAIDNFTFGPAIDDLPPPSLEHSSYIFASPTALDLSEQTVGNVFSGTLSGNHEDDYFKFDSDGPATLTFEVFWSNDSIDAQEYTFSAIDGFNQFRIEAPPGLESAREYGLILTGYDSPLGDGLHTLEQALAAQGILNLTNEQLETIANTMKTLDQTKIGETVENLNKYLGPISDGMKLGLDAAKYTALVGSGGDWQRELFVDFFSTAAESLVVGGITAAIAFNPETWPELIGLVAADTAVSVTYTVELDGWVHNFFNQIYSDISGGGAPSGAQAEGVADSNPPPPLVPFDAAWYLATYADAALAVQQGQYASAYQHYLAVGAAEGHLPSASGPALTPADLVGAGASWLNQANSGSQLFTAPLGGLAGDGSNSSERAIVGALNDDRQATLTIDGGLNAFANRLAHDLSINNANGAAASFAADPAGWADHWSTGQALDTGPGTVLHNFGSYAVLAAFASEFSSADDVLSNFYQTPSNLELLQSITYDHVGVAEYGGVWVIVLSNGASGDTVADETGLRTYLGGTDASDFLVLGSHVGTADGGNGADFLFAGVGGGNTLTGDAGDDTLHGARAVIAPTSEPDFANGTAAHNSTFATAASINGAFDLDPNANIADPTTIPHATIAGTGSGTVRFYSFTVTAPGAATFDVDGVSAFDSYLTLYNAAGTTLATADDISALDPGSTNFHDSLLTYNFTSAGTYVIEIGAFPGADPIPAGAAFRLNISAPAALVFPAPHADSLLGGDGNDMIYSGVGADTIGGGAGTDTVNYSESQQAVNVSLQTGTGAGGDAQGDVYASIENVVGSSFDDSLRGRDGFVNLLDGGAGNDVIEGGTGADVLNGGDGIDTLSYATSFNGVDVRLFSGAAAGGAANGDVYTDFENIIGSSKTDTLAGDDGANTIHGGAGNETITGRDGDDHLFGDAGNDTLLGGNGADVLVGSAGADTLGGGSDNDTADYSASTAGISVNLQAGTGSGGDAQGDTLVSIENVIGSAFADTLAGKNNWDNVLDGGAGADTLSGGTGNDTFVFHAGQANGDTILDFSHTAAGNRDHLDFEGYGTAAAGATFVQVDATHWQINSADGTHHDVITISNGVVINAADYIFGGG